MIIFSPLTLNSISFLLLPLFLNKREERKEEGTIGHSTSNSSISVFLFGKEKGGEKEGEREHQHMPMS